jgi:RND superfamily putative drug exporter
VTTTHDQPLLGRVAVWSFTHRWRAVGAWLLLLVVVSSIARWQGSAFLDDFSGGNSQSQQAEALLSRTFPAESGDRAQIVFHGDSPLTEATQKSSIETVVRQARGISHVTSVSDPFAPAGAAQVSRDGRTAYALVQFDETTDRLPSDAANRLLDVVNAHDHGTLHVVVGGAPIAKVQHPGFGKSEEIGLVAALLILLFSFGAVVAAGLPIVTALFGLAVSFGILALISHAQTVPTWASEFAALLGIGVGIDYALFIVTRYRERLADGDAPVDAVAVALSTSGRAVLFAGGTVVVSLFGLFAVGLPYITGAALGAIFAVLLVMASALSLLPAILGLLGRRIDTLSVRRKSKRTTVIASSWAWRWSHAVQRRPVVYSVAATAALVTLSIPLFSLRVGYSDAGNDPTTTETRMAYDLVAHDFGPGAVSPLVLVTSLPTSAQAQADLADLTSRIGREPGVAAVTPPRFNAAHDAAVVDVIPRSSPQAESTVRLVHRLRQVVSDTPVTGFHPLIGGETAASIDSATHLSHRLAVVIVFVVVVSMLLLLGALRSPVIAAKAAVMNLLSTGAAYGVIVAAFQWGWFGNGLTAGRTGPIDPWIPVMLFTILFGLSMDYELFLMSRVREHWLLHRDTHAAVIDGVAATARVITAAAAIMVCVFASFSLSDIRPLRIFGLGMATAVLVDATIVRMVLVPSAMRLLGGTAWWMPSWLDRILPGSDPEADLVTEPTTTA